MGIDPKYHYTMRLGSDNQVRVFFDNERWHYEYLAGGVLFDKQGFPSIPELETALGVLGISLDQLAVDADEAGRKYSEAVRQTEKRLASQGIAPCPKHGYSSKNEDGSCEACLNIYYPDDFKGSEG